MRAAIYARVSTTDQSTEPQVQEARRYVRARSWAEATEYVDHGVSGAKDRRPALDRLIRNARRGRVDVIVIWSLDRLGRSLRHLVVLLDEMRALNIALVSLREGLDLSTPAGRLQWQIIGAISEFERARIVERVQAGLQRAKRQGRTLGRPQRIISRFQLARVEGLSTRAAAKVLGIPRSTLQRYLAQKPL